MRRRRSSKTNSGSSPGSSRPRQTPSRPIDIPAPKSSEAWPAPEVPYQAYTSHSLPGQQQTRPAYRPSLGVFQDLSPGDWLSQSPDDYQKPELSVTPSPTVLRDESQPQDLSLLSVSTAPGYAWEQYSLSRSVSDSGMTTASTATSEPMSRKTTNEMLIEPLQMCRVASHVSEGNSPDTTTTMNDCARFDVDSIFPLLDSTLLNSLSDVPLDSFSSSSSLPQSFLPSSVDMLPSPSQESNSSSTSSESSQSRHVRTVQEQNARSKRPLAPKSQSQKAGMATPPATFVEVVEEDGTRKKKAQICRYNPQPKETTKVFCHICSDHPEGFHGDHELRRHIDRTHKDTRKVFVCKDISPDGTFLANCKHCRNMKTYGANYNAAAHLRRVHFNPAETPKGGRGKVSQGRGGIGGGDYPGMDVLKNWMVETLEVNLNGQRREYLSATNTAPAASCQQSVSDSGMLQHNDAVQMSDADLDYVQQLTQLDMSFLRDSTNSSFSLPMQSTASSDSFFAPAQHDLPSQYDVPFFNAEFLN
jgi:hypothetical protein